ncbi:MAG: thioredoxin, partial [Nitrososphaeraceae archaeon]
YLRVKTPLEISIIKRGDHSELGNYLNRKFHPNAITAIVNESDISELEKYPYFKKKSSNNSKDKELAFVCKDFTCSLPINTIKELEKNIS